MYAHVNISAKGKTRKKEHRFNEKRVQKRKKKSWTDLEAVFRLHSCKRNTFSDTREVKNV